MIRLTFFLSRGMISYTNHTFMEAAEGIMEFPEGKFAWMVKIGEKGQFVIPKEARDMFDLQPGSTILVLGDAKRGLAILPREMQSKYIAKIFAELGEEEQDDE